VALRAGGRIALPPLAQELAVYAVQGELVVDGTPLPEHTMAVLAPQATVVSAAQDARFVVIGGDALESPRFMWWNFVSSRKERVLQASEDWEAQRMGAVPGENEFIPLPPTPFTPPEPRS
jgi:redox-sensitive bicupin YhaK (pirin superfamily)